MKKYLIGVIALISLIPMQASAESETAEALLHQMSQASNQLNYELSYVLIRKNSIEPLMYRHSSNEEQTLEHVIYLSGPVREVIRRGGEVSYIEQGIEPFSLAAESMVAPLPPLMNRSITQLAQYYDFISMGRSREAGSACDVVRIVPKDGHRYSYLVWIDERSNLPLRTDLIDRDGEVIEQYKVISYAVNDKIADLMSGLNKATLPEVVTFPKQPVSDVNWKLGWLPEGFQVVTLNRYRLENTQREVESQMFTDGLFTFSVYISDADSTSLKEQLVRQGRRTLHSQVKNKREVTVIGDIPIATAKRIAESITFDSHGNTSTK
ncbi:MAG: sigma-E factor regulatory protein RseB [Aliivibrio sp.]|uniref:sigma-E factor regulatory protein RseB n=1 Tax=Aliivibrio sp. TaxID=1872443 RepID=UPI001A55B262|nr:sigma-E factor regulatory protein RseB [Aliivibrio sp.]